MIKKTQDWLYTGTNMLNEEFNKLDHSIILENANNDLAVFGIAVVHTYLNDENKIKCVNLDLEKYLMLDYKKL